MEEVSGFGMQLISTLVQQLDGSFRIDRSGVPGMMGL
jgi:two-component sensor histidine kinase